MAEFCSFRLHSSGTVQPIISKTFKTIILINDLIIVTHFVEARMTDNLNNSI